MRFERFIRAGLICLLPGVIPNVHGQFTQQGNKLAGTGGLSVPGNFAGVYQGGAVALSADGNTMAAGGCNDSGGIGAVWVFTRNNGTWTQQGSKLVGTGPVGSSCQGYSVALSQDGSTLVEGGSLDNHGVGALWVFTRSNGTWTQQGAKLTPFYTSNNVRLGTSVAISADGNSIVGGGPYDSCGYDVDCWGAGWTFTRANGHWTQGFKLAGDLSSFSGPMPMQGQGVAMSASGNTVLIGGPNDRDAQNNIVGGAWAFTREAGGGWTQQELIGSGGTGSDIEQGWSVALSADGNTAAAGGPADHGGVGAVWVFTRTNGVWTQQGNKLVGTMAAGEPGQGGQEGLALSADGNTLVVSGTGDNNSAGALWVFQRSNGVWTQQGNKLVGTGAAGNANQGFSVALSADGTTVADGGITDNTNKGAIWVFVQPRANRFSLAVPATATAGAPFQFTVTAQDSNSQPYPGYTGTVHFSSSDPNAMLPPNATLVNGTGTFSATMATSPSQTITATDTSLSSITGVSSAIAVPGGTGGTAPGGVTPAYGTGTSQSMTFTFSDPRGTADLDVVNVLINNFLDGRNACYLAYSRPGGTLYLVADDGGTLLGLALNGSGSVSNSQCTVNASGSSVSPAGTILTLTLNLSFTSGFAGNKIVYMAARDLQGGNSGWQALGTWCVPGYYTTPSVTAVTPARGTASNQAFTFTFSDTKGAADLGVINALINGSLDGRQACYVAYSQPGQVLYLVSDAGGGLSQGLPLGGMGSVSNSQCTINAAGSSASTSGSTLTLTLNIAFAPTFDGNRVVYLAARDKTEANNSGWQAMGTWTVE